MKVLLIYPYPRHNTIPDPYWLPLGLSFLAAFLKDKGHTVSIFDRYSSQASIGLEKEKINAAMLSHIREFQPDLIGLNTVSPLIYDTVECVELIRQVYSGLMVAGGHHTTALPELTLSRLPGLDGVVVGEGETALAALAAGKAPTSVPGVWWRNGDGSFNHTAAVQIEDLDSLPFPALDLMDMKFYTLPGRRVFRGYYLTSVSMLTSRGCVRKCDFCSESLTYGKGVRFHSVDYVMEWLERVLCDYKVEGVYFHDNDFLIDENRARQICERILASGLNKKIKWGIQARAERINRDTLKLLRRSGCVLIEIGVESSLQKQLDSVKKGVTVTANEKAIALCRREGISVHANFITGFEGEGILDLEEKLGWLKRTKPSTFAWFPLQVYPGTQLYNRSGGSFFEKNEWTEDNIREYYSRNPVSSITKAQREDWMKQHYTPYLKRKNRLHILRVNPPLKLAPFVVKKIKRTAGKLLNNKKEVSV
jgi:anaerobic magnesium-protoporphyrin IX monomethyl ester cyclase